MTTATVFPCRASARGRAAATSASPPVFANPATSLAATRTRNPATLRTPRVRTRPPAHYSADAGMRIGQVAEVKLRLAHGRRVGSGLSTPFRVPRPLRAAKPWKFQASAVARVGRSRRDRTTSPADVTGRVVGGGEETTARGGQPVNGGSENVAQAQVAGRRVLGSGRRPRRGE